MYRKKKTTVRIDLTNDEDLAKYDEIVNDPLSTIVEELIEHRTITDFTASGGEDGGGTTTTVKIPFKIITYETRELAL